MGAGPNVDGSSCQQDPLLLGPTGYSDLKLFGLAGGRTQCIIYLCI